MGNIQPPERRNVERAADIVTAIIPGLIMSDERAGGGVGEVARGMRITAAPKHPGRDPVSGHIVEELVSVLRGEDGLASRLGAAVERLRKSAAQLEASRRAHQVTDEDIADDLGYVLDEHRP